MAITVFADVILSNTVLAAGVRGRQVRQNRRVSQVNGAEYVNVGWEQTLREYDWSTVPLRRADWQYMEALHEVTDGGAYGFLMQDPKDCQVTSGGLLAGLGSNHFQLYRRYTNASRTRDRKITRPRAAGFVLMVSGVSLTVTTDYTLDSATGIVTIPSNPSPSLVTWTGYFYVPVHFGSDTIDWTMVISGPDPDARYLSGPSVVLQEIRE